MVAIGNMLSARRYSFVRRLDVGSPERDDLSARGGQGPR